MLCLWLLFLCVCVEPPKIYIRFHCNIVLCGGWLYSVRINSFHVRTGVSEKKTQANERGMQCVEFIETASHSSRRHVRTAYIGILSIRGAIVSCCWYRISHSFDRQYTLMHFTGFAPLFLYIEPMCVCVGCSTKRKLLRFFGGCRIKIYLYIKVAA